MQDYKNPEVLQKVYAECGSLVKTAAYFGVSKKLILTHLKRFGITRNPPRSKKPIDAEQARALLESGVPVGQVAKEAGVSVGTVRHPLQEKSLDNDRLHQGDIKTWSAYRLLPPPEQPPAHSPGNPREHI